MIAQRIDEKHIGLVMDNATAEILQALLGYTEGDGAASDRLDTIWRPLKALGFDGVEPENVDFAFTAGSIEITGP